MGQGLYALAGAGTALALLVLLGLNRLERRIPAHSYHTVAVSVQGTEVQRAEEACRGLFSQAGQRVLAVDVRLDREEERACLTFYVRSTGEVKATQLAEGLLSLPGVSEVSWR